VQSRNGYCIVLGCAFATATTYSEFSCPSGSDCNKLYGGGICQKTCTLATAASCRGHSGDKFGDYECRAWSNLSISGVAIAKGPVCDFGPLVSCSFMPSTLDCSSLGDKTNSTNMTCRKMNNTKTTNSHDPEGWCLDDTASGPVGPTPDGGVDAGKDAGADRAAAPSAGVTQSATRGRQRARRAYQHSTSIGEGGLRGRRRVFFLHKTRTSSTWLVNDVDQRCSLASGDVLGLYHDARRV
jgi:hypothetical protein